MAQPRTARLGLGFVWGVLGFSLIAIIVILSREGRSPVDQYEQQRAENRLKTRLELEEAAEKKLSEYAWVNKEKGVVAIPIDRAMELTVAELQTKKVADSNEKAVIMPSMLIPPYLQEGNTEAPAAEGEAAPAAEGAEAAPTEAAPESAPAAPAEATPAAPEATPSEPAAPAPAEASGEEAPETEPAAPAATEAAPAAPETPSEP